MSDTHEVYPNAPLALVAVEVRFPGPSERWPLPMALQRAFRDTLGDQWVSESIRTNTVELASGPAAGDQPNVRQVVLPRFTLRDRTLAVALSDESLTVETTSYRHYLGFRLVLQSALRAAEEIVRPGGVARVGMRYIDEIRVPNAPDADVPDWREWIDHSLLPPRVDEMATSGYRSVTWQGVAQYDAGQERTLVLRHGAHDGYAVNPNALLRRPSVPAPGPFFMLDFDCFWQPIDIPTFDSDSLVETCDGLRAPIRSLFDLLIPDKLREEVFMREPING